MNNEILNELFGGLLENNIYTINTSGDLLRLLQIINNINYETDNILDQVKNKLGNKIGVYINGVELLFYSNNATNISLNPNTFNIIEYSNVTNVKNIVFNGCVEQLNDNIFKTSDLENDGTITFTFNSKDYTINVTLEKIQINTQINNI